MKKKLVIANWKMNPTSLKEAKKLFTGAKKTASKLTKTQTIIAPPYLFLSELAKGYRGTKLSFAAQDVSSEQKGSFTGEVSALMLKDVGVRYVIVGHSERRALGETNELVHKKLMTAITSGLTVVLCIGEAERDRDAEYLSFLKEQLVVAIRSLEPKHLKRLVIAYEPVWAIGKDADDAMKSHDIHQMVVFIRKIIAERHGKKEALKIPVLYGGSVERANAAKLASDAEVAGFLVGHASLDPEEFNDIVMAVEQA